MNTKPPAALPSMMPSHSAEHPASQRPSVEDRAERRGLHVGFLTFNSARKRSPRHSSQESKSLDKTTHMYDTLIAGTSMPHQHAHLVAFFKQPIGLSEQQHHGYCLSPLHASIFACVKLPAQHRCATGHSLSLGQLYYHAKILPTASPPPASVLLLSASTAPKV